MDGREESGHQQTLYTGYEDLCPVCAAPCREGRARTPARNIAGSLPTVDAPWTRHAEALVSDMSDASNQFPEPKAQSEATP